MATSLGATKVERKSAQFEVSAALLEELGERLVSKPEIALAELVKNAYDADSPSCRLTLTPRSITVTDEGHGMTEEDFRHRWMVISTQTKGTERFSRTFGRRMAGSKGVGRFSARYLGNIVTLTTVAEDPKTKVRTQLIAEFDWKLITSNPSMAAVTIPFSVAQVDRTVDLGTKLHITGLRMEATRISPSTLKTDLLRLTDPAAGLEKPHFDQVTAITKASRDPGFSVIFDGLADEVVDENGISQSIEQKILDAYVGRVRLSVDEDGQLDYQVFWKGHDVPLAEESIQIDEIIQGFTADVLTSANGQKADARGLVKEVESIQHLPVSMALNSPVFVDLRFFPKRKGTFTDVGLNGTVAQSWLKDKASFAVVDNNFAMDAYADTGSDWLGIDASKATNERSWQSIFTPALYPMSPVDKADPARNPMLALARGSQLIGRVHIATRKRPPEREDESQDWLQPNMDRESLRSNGAYHLLWHIARFAAELLAHFDRQVRLQEEASANARKQQEARTSLSAAIQELKSSTVINPAYQKRVIAQLESAELRFSETEQYERSARLSLEIMAMMGVMAGFMTHEFEKAMDNLHSAAAGLNKLAILNPVLKKAAQEIQQHELALAEYLDYMRVFVERAREPVPTSFKAKGQVSRVLKTLSPVAQAHAIDIEIEIDSKLAGPFVPVAAYNGIIINLVSNAIKALVPKISTDARKIRLYATNDGVNHILVCADTGIGIPPYMRTRIWEPLFSTTKARDENNPLGTGLGLGLSVVNEVVKKMSGKIELMDVVPLGYTTAFKLTLPLENAV